VDGRFGTVPSDIAQAVEHIEGRKTLESLLRHLFHCDSLDAFRTLLQEAGSTGVSS
jgi:hypothetical protein